MSLRRQLNLFFLLPALAALTLAAQAQSKMYKCTGNGRTVYQQTACADASTADAVTPPEPAASARRSGASRAPMPPASAGAPAAGASGGRRSPAERKA